MQTERNGPGADPPGEAVQRLARLARLPMIQLRWSGRSYGALAAFWVAACGLLWAGGHPPPRITTVAACFLAQAAATLRFVLRGTGPVELGAYPPGALRLGLLHLATTGLALAATGGILSPLFVTLLMPAVTSLALFGAVRESRILGGATAALIVLLGALPAALRGAPPSGRPGHLLGAASLLVSLAVVGINVLRLRAGIRDRARELSRVREELATQALARARGLEEVGSQVAHELKNPLAAVKALAQLGRADDAPAAARPAFAAIDREVSAMQAVLAEYLSFARPLEALRREPTDLAAVAEEALAVLEPRARRAGVQLRRRGHAAASADRRRLGEAILNLVANAIEATPPGGRVELDVAAGEGTARVVVRDTGRGMAPEVLARAGTPFFTTREGGTGLGIVLARSVLEQHGGALRLASAPGDGTTATASLPLDAPDAAPSVPPTPGPVRLRLPWAGVVVAVGFQAIAIGATALGGLPLPIVLGVAAIGLVKLVPTLCYAAREGPALEPDAYPPSALVLGLAHVVGGAGWMALTGGLASPFLLMLFPPAIVSLALFDAAWQSRVVLGATLAATALLAALPPGLTGPVLGGGAGALVAGAAALGAILIVSANLARARELLGASGRAIARARDELASHAVARARSLEEVGARVARELEAPLAAIGRRAGGGAAAADDARSRQWLEVIGREVGRMQGILAEYLAFARPLQSFRPEPVELGPLVADVLDVLAGRAARAGVRGDCRGAAAVTADPRRLKEALLNLVANAIEATPAGGRVEVEVGREDGSARIAIRDTGRGMAPEVLARIGTPFFTTRDAGTGLGVVLARSVFQRHGGALRYESAPGRGTTVVATLPLDAGARRFHGDRAAGG